MYDEDFKHFSKWVRSYYGKKYPRSKLREINYHGCLKFAGSFMLSIAMYVVLHSYFSAYAKIWFLPFWLFNLFFVVSKEEVVHARSHWTTNMTGSLLLDNVVDWSMMAFCGTSKESFRRRHIAAHYADVANVARIFSDVWLPFITLPPIFYFQPHRIIKIFLDVEYCKREKLSRAQIFVEIIGLYSYLVALAYELYNGSYFLVAFHMTPLLYFHAGNFLGASICHSGIDKRNSFNSNGLFDHETATGLFQVSLYCVNYASDFTVANHGIHHAFTQLPLSVINRDYKMLNKFILDNYKDVRFNNTLTMIVLKDLFARCGPPQWYDYIIQFMAVQWVFLMTVITIAGFDMPPAVWEPLLVDYRVYLKSTKTERYVRFVAMWQQMELPQRSKEEMYKNANAYFWKMLEVYTNMVNYLDANAPGWQPAKLDPIAPTRVMDLMVSKRGKLD
jgi:hypothetical protein